MKDIFNKICHARQPIYFCFDQNCDNCKYYINLLKELNLYVDSTEDENYEDLPF